MPMVPGSFPGAIKSWSYEAVEVFAEDGSGHIGTYCETHIPEGVLPVDVAPIFIDSEVDHYPVCETCGREHRYMKLTQEGKDMLRVRVEEKYKGVADLLDAARVEREMEDEMHHKHDEWPDRCDLIQMVEARTDELRDLREAVMDALVEREMEE